MARKARIQFIRKLGHLWQAFYGLPGHGTYGYGATRKLAAANAREESARCRHGMFRSGAGACPQCGR